VALQTLITGALIRYESVAEGILHVLIEGEETSEGEPEMEVLACLQTCTCGGDIAAGAREFDRVDFHTKRDDGVSTLGPPVPPVPVPPPVPPPAPPVPPPVLALGKYQDESPIRVDGIVLSLFLFCYIYLIRTFGF